MILYNFEDCNVQSVTDNPCVIHFLVTYNFYSKRHPHTNRVEHRLLQRPRQEEELQVMSYELQEST